MLRPWMEFPSVQQTAFDEVYSILHPPNDTTPRLFSPLLHIKELGRTMTGRKIGSEDDLRLFQHSAVENFVADIISTLANNQVYSKDLPFGQGVTFENHTNTLNDMAEDVQTRLQFSTSSSNPRRTPKPIRADQMCVYKNEDGQSDLLFVIEYKAPHKLTKELLRAGLRAMDVPKEAINRPTIPTDLHEKFNYNADRLVAAAATQPYSYMLESGVEYSCIITGEAMVFLWIKADLPVMQHLSPRPVGQL